jgi:hypothetical protein
MLLHVCYLYLGGLEQGQLLSVTLPAAAIMCVCKALSLMKMVHCQSDECVSSV